MNTYADAAAVQRIVNVLAAVEFLHGHEVSMSLAERLALNEPEQSKPEEPKSAPTVPELAEPPKEAEQPEDDGLTTTTDGWHVQYFDKPERATSLFVRVGSVLRRKGEDADYVVVQTDKHLARVDKPFRKHNGEVNLVVNLARSHNWLLVGEVPL